MTGYSTERLFVHANTDPHIMYLLMQHELITAEGWDRAIDDETMVDEYMEKMRNAWKLTVPNTRQRIEAAGLPENEVWQMRSAYLREQFRKLTKEKYRTGVESEALKQVKNELTYQNKNDLSEQDIETARKYPMANLIETKRGKAKCPFHNERTASFSVRENLYHCFGCSAGGDSIQFIRESLNKNFPDAVRHLNSL